MRSSLYVTLMSGGTAFDPASLFAKYNASGFYLPFSKDPTRSLGGGLLVPMYQNRSGVVSQAVTADGESIAFAIDESQGAAVGSEIVTNGDFGTGDLTGWSVHVGTPTYSAGGALCNSANEGIKQVLTTEAGAWYRISWSAAFTGTGISQQVFLGTTDAGTQLFYNSSIGNSTGTYEIYFQATTTTSYLTMRVSGAPDASNYVIFDDITCAKVAGNHAYQDTAAAKPTFKTGSPNFARGDGVDDNLLSSLNPATTMTLLAIGTPAAGAGDDALIGSAGEGGGRAYLSISTAGYVSGGVGDQSLATIVDGSSEDIRSTRCGMAVQWNGTTVRLFVKTAGGSFRKAYEAAQSGAVNTTVPLRVFALNSNGTASAHFPGDSEAFQAITAEVTEADIESVFDYHLNL